MGEGIDCCLVQNRTKTKVLGWGGSPAGWHGAGCVPQIRGLFWDGPLLPPDQGAWERGEMGEGLGRELGLPSPRLSHSRGAQAHPISHWGGTRHRTGLPATRPQLREAPAQWPLTFPQGQRGRGAAGLGARSLPCGLGRGSKQRQAQGPVQIPEPAGGRRGTVLPEGTEGSKTRGKRVGG